MTGFQNVEDGIKHFFGHIASTVDADVAAAAKALQPLLSAVTDAIKKQGLPIVEKAILTIATTAASALEGGQTKSAAATAAIAAVKTAGIDLGEDALHALATAAVAETLK